MVPRGGWALVLLPDDLHAYPRNDGAGRWIHVCGPLLSIWSETDPRTTFRLKMALEDARRNEDVRMSTEKVNWA